MSGCVSRCASIDFTHALRLYFLDDSEMASTDSVKWMRNLQTIQSLWSPQMDSKNEEMNLFFYIVVGIVLQIVHPKNLVGFVEMFQVDLTEGKVGFSALA